MKLDRRQLVLSSVSALALTRVAAQDQDYLNKRLDKPLRAFRSAEALHVSFQQIEWFKDWGTESEMFSSLGAYSLSFDTEEAAKDFYDNSMTLFDIEWLLTSEDPTMPWYSFDLSKDQGADIEGDARGRILGALVDDNITCFLFLQKGVLVEVWDDLYYFPDWGPSARESLVHAASNVLNRLSVSQEFNTKTELSSALPTEEDFEEDVSNLKIRAERYVKLKA